jgi:effector-binding domain-containing protein
MKPMKMLLWMPLLAITLLLTPAHAQTTPSEPPAASVPAAEPASLPAGPKAMAERPDQSSLPDTVTITGRPALIVSGNGLWEGGYEMLSTIFQRLDAAATKASLKKTGYPIAIFRETTDTGFVFDAMIPIDSTPTATPADFPPELKFGSTPSGAAVRFIFQASYDEIEGAYEQITAYLDAKSINVEDAFIEEYITLGAQSDDPATDINIYVKPKP